MKKVTLVSLLCMCTLFSIHAQDVIPFSMTNTDGLRWVKDTVIGTEGGRFTGYVNRKGEKSLIGKISVESEMGISGQWENGNANGFVSMFSPGTSYCGMVKDAQMEGYGKMSVGQYSFSGIFSNNKPIGLLFQERSYNYFVGVIYTKGKEDTEPAYEYYVQHIYEANKEYIKKLCSEANVRYVEDTEVSQNEQRDIIYSGGWKDGHPYFYGTYHSSASYSNKFVKIGYIYNDNQTGDTNVENIFEEYVQPNEGRSFHRKRYISNTDTIYTYLGTDCYEKRVNGNDGKFKEFDYVDKNQNIRFLGYRGDKMWGYAAYADGIKEGFLSIDNKNDIDISFEKYVATTGQISNKCADGMVHHNPFGDSILVIKESGSYWDGKYYYTNGEYFIGMMYNGNPTYGKVFFADNEFKQYIGTQNDAEEAYNNVIDFLSTPASGYGTYTYANSETYTGEWNNHKPNGNGEKIGRNEDEELLWKGVWEDGSFISGEKKETKKDGEIVISKGEWRDGTTLVKGLVQTIYADSSYYEESIGISPKVVNYKLYFEDFPKYSTEDVTVIARTNYDSKQLIIEKLQDYAIVTYNDGKRIVGQIELTDTDVDNALGLSFNQIDSCRIIFQEGLYEGAYSKEEPKNGIYTDNSKNIVIGLFVCDSKNLSLPQGQAVINYADGSHYEGGVLEGMRNGTGILTLPNGDKISSNWIENLTSGAESTYTWADGKQFIGNIQKGKLKKGKYLESDGTEIKDKKVLKNLHIVQYNLEIQMPQKPKQPKEPKTIIGSVFNALFGM